MVATVVVALCEILRCLQSTRQQWLCWLTVLLCIASRWSYFREVQKSLCRAYLHVWRPGEVVCGVAGCCGVQVLISDVYYGLDGCMAPIPGLPGFLNDNDSTTLPPTVSHLLTHPAA
jgi:hypothetical protein